MNLLTTGVALAGGATLGAVLVALQYLPPVQRTAPQLAKVVIASALWFGGLTALGLAIAPRAGVAIGISGGRAGTTAVVVGLVVAGAALGVALRLLDRIFFADVKIPHLQAAVEAPRLLRLAAGMLYGGLGEEILFRLVLLSAVVWAARTLGADGTLQAWIGCAIVATLFAAGHLPLVLRGENRSARLVERTLLLNGLAGVAYTLCCLRFGFLAAVVAHAATHLVLQAPHPADPAK